jgi:hypothetical protein
MQAAWYQVELNQKVRMAPPIPPMKKRAFRNALDLKLRRCRGDMLQHFLSEVAVKVWNDNFVPATAHYTQGDLKCDGLLKDPLTIFACYGPTNGGDGQTDGATAKVVTKVIEDFEGALKKWPNLKGWVFVSSYVQGIPPQITAKVMEIQRGHPELAIKQMGMTKFQELIFAMGIEDVEELRGDAATEEDFRALQFPEIQIIVDGVMAKTAIGDTSDDKPVVVPADKLEFNNLSEVYRDLIKLAFRNARRVSGYLLDHPIPTLGEDVARMLKTRYLELKSQHLSPDSIMDELYEFTLAGQKTSTPRMVAIWSLLAYLFEKCTIFEDRPLETITTQ